MKILPFVFFILILANIVQFILGKELRQENQTQKATISSQRVAFETLAKNSLAKSSALTERENSKQKDKENLNNEFKKLEGNQSPDYRTWADTVLPDNVFDIMRGN